MRTFKSISDIAEFYKKGTFLTIVVERTAEIYKKFEGEVSIVKRSTYTSAKMGMDRDKMKEVIALRKSGVYPEKNAGLPWGTWAQFPYHIEHKGTDYVRFFGQKDKVSNQWFLNGKEVAKSDILEYLTAKEKTYKESEGTLLTLSPKLKNFKNIVPESDVKIELVKGAKEVA